MKFRNCPRCRKYKHISNNGLCRSCNMEESIVLGKDISSKNMITIRKNELIGNCVSIGCTNKDILDSYDHHILEQIDKNLIYFDRFDTISRKEAERMNYDKIKLPNPVITDLLHPNLNPQDSNYDDEIICKSKIISEILRSISDWNMISGNHNLLFEEILRSYIGTNMKKRYRYIRKILNDKSLARDVINKTEYDLSSNKENKIQKAINTDKVYKMSSAIQRLETNKKLKKCIDPTKSVSKDRCIISFGSSSMGNKEVSIIAKAMLLLEYLKSDIYQNNKEKILYVNSLDDFGSHFRRGVSVKMRNKSTSSIGLILNWRYKKSDWTTDIVSRSDYKILFYTKDRTYTELYDYLDMELKEIDSLSKHQGIVRMQDGTKNKIKSIEKTDLSNLRP